MTCFHFVTHRGPDVPLVHGSYQTQVCDHCGCWRMIGHTLNAIDGSVFPKSGWRDGEPKTTEGDDE